MPHIHDLIDLTVSAYIVYDDKILLMHHKKLGAWMQVGGHVELHEDTDEAIAREIEEECGVEVTFVEPIDHVTLEGSKLLRLPHFMNLHDYSPTHKHLDLAYVCLAKSSACRLAPEEAREIGWFGREEFDRLNLFDGVRYFCEKALDIAAKARLGLTRLAHF